VQEHSTRRAAAESKVGGSDDDTDTDDDLDVAQPPLHRQLSSRTSALQMVGLDMFRDQLVQLGFESIDDIQSIRTEDLASLGMSQLQQACFEALRADVGRNSAVQPSSANSEASTANANEDALCSVCEDRAAKHTLNCCGDRICNHCFVESMVHSKSFLECPFRCGEAISSAVSADILKGHCVCCGNGLPHSDADAPASPGTVHVRCGFDHRAHEKCFREYLSKSIKQREYPVTCPAGQVCKCFVAEATVLECLAGDELVLRNFYDAAVDHATTNHGFHRQCPNPECGHAIDIGLASNRVGLFRTVRCAQCTQEWCSNCWLTGHPGVACDEFKALKEHWMAFLASQDSISEELQTELKNFRDLCASEKFKADVMRHCPHCGLLTFKVWHIRCV